MNRKKTVILEELALKKYPKLIDEDIPKIIAKMQEKNGRTKKEILSHLLTLSEYLEHMHSTAMDRLNRLTDFLLKDLSKDASKDPMPQGQEL